MVNVISCSLILLGTILSAIAALLIKRSTKNFQLLNIWRSILFWWGLTLYGVGTLLYLYLLKIEPLNVVFPLSSLGYVWATVLSIYYLKEKMNVWKWVGLFGIVVGVIFLGLGS